MVILAATDPLLRRRWRQALAGGPPLREARTQREFEAHLATAQRALALLSLDLEGLGGLDGAAALVRSRPQTRIVLCVPAPIPREALAALKAGVRGYGAAALPAEQLRRLVDRVRRGEVWLERWLVGELLDELASLVADRERQLLATLERGQAVDGALPAAAGASGLTARQRQVVVLLVRGASNKEIAAHLGVAEKTVKAHLTRIFRTFDVANRLQLAVRLAGVEGRFTDAEHTTFVDTTKVSTTFGRLDIGSVPYCRRVVGLTLDARPPVGGPPGRRRAGGRRVEASLRPGGGRTVSRGGRRTWRLGLSAVLVLGGVGIYPAALPASSETVPAGALSPAPHASPARGVLEPLPRRLAAGLLGVFPPSLGASPLSLDGRRPPGWECGRLGGRSRFTGRRPDIESDDAGLILAATTPDWRRKPLCSLALFAAVNVITFPAGSPSWDPNLPPGSRPTLLSPPGIRGPPCE